MILKRKQSKGIGLLELMLSLAIIAVLLIMATRYFEGARANQQINQAIQTFQDVYAACSQAILSNPSSSCDIQDLVTAGYLSAGYKTSSGDSNPMNPFGGNLTSSYSGGTQTVELDDVPLNNNICDTIAKNVFSSMSTGQQLIAGSTYTAGTAEVSDVSCGGSSGSTSTVNMQAKY